MNTDREFDPFANQDPGAPTGTVSANKELQEEVRRLQAKTDAFRDIADRFYMLWWNLPAMDLRQVDRDIRDMFRMYMDLAPSFGVSRNGITELKECCGRRRVWRDDPISATDETLVMPPAKDPIENLGWCPGDIIRRVTRLFGAKFCEACDRRRHAINALFRCGR